jgi:D-cysteine desulfhydrase
VDDSFLLGGYEKTNAELDRLVSTSLIKFGFLMDATYSGKAFLGMKELLKDYPKNHKTLFWNTGGQFNFFAK